MNACLAGSCTPRLALVLGLAVTCASSPVRAASHAGPPLVYSAVVDSIIQPVSAEYITATLDRADLAGAALVVLTLRTPGGLVESTRAIVSHMVAARTPVVIFVAPSGARAASAGFILTIAADVAAMAPGTHIGAAHPVDGSGQKMDETMAAKMTEDLAAYARTLAGRRHRNVTLAAEAVSKSRAFTEEEARDATPPLIDLVATDLPDLLRQLDGRTITRFDGASAVLHTANARVVDIEMTLRQRVLSAVANPTRRVPPPEPGHAGLTIELWNPGAIVPGIVGGTVPAARVLRVLDAARQRRRSAAAALRAAAARARDQGDELRPAHRRRDREPGLRIDDPRGLPVAGAAVEPAPGARRSCSASRASRRCWRGWRCAAQRRRPSTGAAAMVGATGQALTAIDAGAGASPPTARSGRPPRPSRFRR